MRITSLVLFAMLFAVSGGNLLAKPPVSKCRTALDDYVYKDDPTYKWELVKKVEGKTSDTFMIKLTSQTWRTKKDVDRPVWDHWLVVVKPKEVKFSKALIFVGGGKTGRSCPDRADDKIRLMAESTGSVVAELKAIPNQTLTFHNDGVPRVEDDLIGYCWAQYLETGDVTWLPRLPMVKSVVKAMDCLQEWSEKQGRKIDGFVIAGASKRGWTTWMTGAVDRRVEAIIPIVIDVANTAVSLRHHAEAYGFWAEAIGNYYQHKLLQRSDHPRMKEIYEVVDPYCYIDRLTMPKYVLNGSGDQFFCPDSSQFYYSDLKGEKLLRYIPNADHSLKAPDTVTSLIAWYQMFLSHRPFPHPGWSFEKDGSIIVRSDIQPKKVLLWQATNPKARDFRLRTIGKAYKSTELKQRKDGSWKGSVEEPKEGWTAFFVELEYDSGGQFPLKATTSVRILPDVLPFKGINLNTVPYEPFLKGEGNSKIGPPDKVLKKK